MIYSSKQNPLIKKIASYKEKKYRTLDGVFVTEGVKTVNEAILNGEDVTLIAATQAIRPKLADSSAQVITVTDEVFKYLSDETTPQGALAVIKRKNRAVQKPAGSALILDGIKDPGNMGTVIRTAAALNYKDLYLINCVDPYSPKCVRASMSGVYFVNIYETDIASALSAVKSANLSVLALDMRGKDLKSYNAKGNVAIIVGGEANGLTEEAKAGADEILSIKMEAQSESLNAAVALSIAMYTLKK